MTVTPNFAAPAQYVAGLAKLAVEFGANVQPGQVVGIGAEVGQEQIVRAVADLAYERGARYVDVSTYDPYVKRSRLLHAPEDSLRFTPPWVGERILQLGELRGARISFEGPTDPHLLEDVNPRLLGLDISPRTRESGVVTGKRLCNWTIVPFVTPGWAELVFPELEPEDAYRQLWDLIAHICRLDEPDPVAAWRSRHKALDQVAAKLNHAHFDAVHLRGPGTDLRIGLLRSSHWLTANLETARGIKHVPNVPTEEIFTAPDPLRVDGVVGATKPLLVPGAAPIHGLRVHFKEGRVQQLEADSGVAILESMCARDEGASRLGELALVDRHSRVGQSGKVFSSILLDENAACHLALGNAYTFTVTGESDLDRLNESDIHVDFMVGAPDVSVFGVTHDGTELPVLIGGDWQL